MTLSTTPGATGVQHVEIRRGRYVDSVSLMQVSAGVAGVDGVRKAQVAMATELNLDVLAQMGFTIPPEAGPNDMVVAVVGDDDAAVAAALEAVDTAIAAIGTGGGAGGFGGEPDARTTRWAARRAHASLAVVSVPGEHAFAEAMGALEAGSSVLVFSDNVPVEHEVRLKEEADARDLLVMGPDCGTAIVNGVGLGFANVVGRGPVGIAAASGTGAQQFTSLLHAAGVGVSHCLGLGGRDLSAEVGGRAARSALRALDADPSTEVIVVVSKPPHPDVARELREYAATLATPVHFALLGAGQPDITAGVENVLAELGHEVPAWRTWGTTTPAPAVVGEATLLRGLFAGGTLCDEAMLIAEESLGDIASNIPLRPELALPADLQHDGHLMIDFGDDTLTQGRPHPMIDPALRLARIEREAADPHTRVILLDVVLGFGAHADPAAELAPVLAQARRTATDAGRDLAVVVSLCGTDADPQGLDAQANALAEAGAVVFLSNAAAARHAVALVTGGTR
ncbi:FdrA family protein [Nocardioides zeae]|uniref:FdrA family protein n=1 Tax=Nocardioides imazamoxiresistens TaxID=3231893 RepID=A0ABU3PXQ7_9ACTN|nr:FdrA family protein [Nocardioides zeae]MDT9594017.1 FdrA family protein [Nocardioides zeae]